MENTVKEKKKSKIGNFFKNIGRALSESDVELDEELENIKAIQKRIGKDEADDIISTRKSTEIKKIEREELAKDIHEKNNKSKRKENDLER